MADKDKNKKENEEYESDGSVVVYRVDNGRGKGKVSGKDGESTYFVRKVTDERWETNLPEPLWLADMLQGGCGAKPPCRDFAIDPFDVISMVRGMLPSDDNECVVIYEDDDDADNDINKFKKGNKMRKYDFFRNGGRYIPYAASGRRLGFYQEPATGIEEPTDETNEDIYKGWKFQRLGVPRGYAAPMVALSPEGKIYTMEYNSETKKFRFKGDKVNQEVSPNESKKLRSFVDLITGVNNNQETELYTSSDINNPDNYYYDPKTRELKMKEGFRIKEPNLYNQLLKSLEKYQDAHLKAVEEGKANLADIYKNQYNETWNELQGLIEPIKGVNNRHGGRFQQGGQMSLQQLMQQIVALVQAAMQGNQEAQDQISQIAQAAENGDPQAQQIYRMIQQVAQKMQGAQSARRGGKFNYIHQLRTGLMPHENIVFNRKGGRLVRSTVDSRRAGGRLQAPKRNYINYFG